MVPPVLKVVPIKVTCTYYHNFRQEFIFLCTKGQIISEQNCGVLNFPKMQQKKPGQIKKIEALYST